MITLGIDLSSMPAGTAACSITWKAKQATALPPLVGCTDDQLDKLITQANVIGIDAPFGWPDDFVAAVAHWTDTKWSSVNRDQFQFRETDRAVRQRVARWPLSVSTDRIALPAMRAMALLCRHGVTDRSGDGRFFEVYPAGSLFCWGFRCRGYKRLDEECLGFRKDILNTVRKNLPWLDVPESYSESSDSLDALIASLTARTASQTRTIKPITRQTRMARREGWIHLPTSLPQL